MILLYIYEDFKNMCEDFRLTADYKYIKKRPLLMQSRYDINVRLKMACHIHYYSKQELKKLVNWKEG